MSDNRALSLKYLISDIPILTFPEGFPTPLSDLSINLLGAGESEQVPLPCFSDKEAKAQKTQFPQKDPGMEPSKIHAYILNVSFPFLSASPEPSQCSFSKHPECIHFSKNPTQTLLITFLSVGVRNHCIAQLRISSILMGFRNGLITAQRSDLCKLEKGWNLSGCKRKSIQHPSWAAKFDPLKMVCSITGMQMTATAPAVSGDRGGT